MKKRGMSGKEEERRLRLRAGSRVLRAEDCIYRGGRGAVHLNTNPFFQLL